MTLCPIALVSGCIKCPVFSVCPMKSVIGDYDPLDHNITRPSIRISDLEQKQKEQSREGS